MCDKIVRSLIRDLQNMKYDLNLIYNRDSPAWSGERFLRRRGKHSRIDSRLVRMDKLDSPQGRLYHPVSTNR